MDFSKKYDFNDDFVYRVVDGEAVVLDISSGEHYSLNKTGTEVFLAVVGGKTLEAILQLQAKKYEIDEDTAKSDIEECVKMLLNEGIFN